MTGRAGGEQRSGVGRPKPPGSVARQGPPLGLPQKPEDGATKRHRGSKKGTRPLRLPQAAVLREEPQVRTKLLAVHRGPHLRRRGAADMNELCIGPEQDRPARRAGAVAEVDLLVEHEEALVEASDLVEQVPPHEEYRPEQEFRLMPR